MVSTSGATIAGAAGAAGAAAAGDAAGDAAGSAAAGDAAGAGAAGANHGLAVPLATHFNSETVPRPSSTETPSIQKNEVGVAHAGQGPLGNGSFAAFAVVATEISPPKSEATPSATRILFFTFPPSVNHRVGEPDNKKSTPGGY